MALTGTVIGFLIGLVIAIIRTIPVSKKTKTIPKIIIGAVNFVLNLYIEVIRGTPMMVQALIIYYSLFVPMKVPPMASAIIIISFNTGAYMAEIVRGGIISVDKGQFEGAAAVGMTHWQTMLHIVLPQVLRNILPSVANEFVINIKDTSVLNVIGVTELYYFAGIIKRESFQTFQTYLVVCVIYFVLTFTVTRVLRLIEKKLQGADSYVICGSQSDSSAEIRVPKQQEVPND